MRASELSPRDVAALLDSSLAILTAEVGALSPDQLAWRPTPDDWCINEVVGHLIEAEQRGFAGRIRHILDHDHPALQSWDPAAIARARDDDARDGRDLLREFTAARRDSLTLLAALTLDTLDRGGAHPVVGDLTVRDLIHEWVFHDRAHIEQILANVRALVWPHMGNARGFAQPTTD